MLRLIGKILLCGLLATLLFILALNLFTRPSNDRDWSPDQDTLSSARIEGDLVHIHNIRNFTYASTASYTPNYYDKTFDLSKLVRAYYIVEPFSGYVGAAHTFLSFEFENDEFVAISIEIRKEQGEIFSAPKALFNQYELMYVIADERDAVKLRSNYRKDNVYVYPVRAEQEKVRELFLDMISRTNKIAAEPEFYNTLFNTCTTNIVAHVNKITDKRVPFSYKILFPEYSDELALDLGLIDTDLPLAQAREKFLINGRALRYADAPDFSRKIRE
jgi:hypothetical protein